VSTGRATPPADPGQILRRVTMLRHLFMAAVATAGLALAASSAHAQGYVQYYTPYTYGSTSYYYYPNTGYAYTYPYSTSYMYNNAYVGPTVYGPGYTANYPYMYNQLNYGYTYPTYSYYNPGYGYRTSRWWR
jgi:hypothetical protein